MASSRATETNLISPLPRSKDFVQRAGRALSPKALKPGKRNARPATILIATLYADSGEKDQAFGGLNTAYQERDRLLIGLKMCRRLSRDAARNRAAGCFPRPGLVPFELTAQTVLPIGRRGLLTHGQGNCRRVLGLMGVVLSPVLPFLDTLFNGLYS